MKKVSKPSKILDSLIIWSISASNTLKTQSKPEQKKKERTNNRLHHWPQKSLFFSKYINSKQTLKRQQKHTMHKEKAEPKIQDNKKRKKKQKKQKQR